MNMRDSYKLISAQVVQHLEPGGIEQLVVELSRAARPDEKFYLVSLEPKKQSAETFLSKVRHINVECIFMDKIPGVQLSLVWQLADFFRQKNITSVHTHHIGPLLYAGTAARIAGVKHVVHTEHDCWHLDDPKHQRIEKMALSFIRPLLVADAKHVAQGLREKVGIDPDCIIKNGIDTNIFMPGDRISSRCDLGLPLDGVIIGSAGRLEPVKGHSYLIRAFAKLDDSFQLAIAGGGSMEKELKELCKSLGISSRVHFLGFTKDMPNFYRSLDLFCLPSVNEGYPLSPLEAQSCGVPVLVADVGGAKETVCPRTGLTFKSKDVEDLLRSFEVFIHRHKIASPRDFVLSVGRLQKTVAQYNALRA
jgi:glycosyltransferase involved in cell wall biosynthesis